MTLLAFLTKRIITPAAAIILLLFAHNVKADHFTGFEDDWNKPDTILLEPGDLIEMEAARTDSLNVLLIRNLKGDLDETVKAWGLRSFVTIKLKNGPTLYGKVVHITDSTLVMRNGNTVKFKNIKWMKVYNLPLRILRTIGGTAVIVFSGLPITIVSVAGGIILAAAGSPLAGVLIGGLGAGLGTVITWGGVLMIHTEKYNFTSTHTYSVAKRKPTNPIKAYLNTGDSK